MFCTCARDASHATGRGCLWGRCTSLLLQERVGKRPNGALRVQGRTQGLAPDCNNSGRVRASQFVVCPRVFVVRTRGLKHDAPRFVPSFSKSRDAPGAKGARSVVNRLEVSVDARSLIASSEPDPITFNIAYHYVFSWVFPVVSVILLVFASISLAKLKKFLTLAKN